MKVAWVVPRYGDDVVGGAESGVQMVAERMISLLGWEMEILTTRALEASTWANHYPEGASELRGVRVQRFSCTGRDPAFDDLSRAVLADPAAASADDQRRWFELQGPVSRGLLDAVAATDADVIVFKPYLYHPTVAGIGVARVPTVLYGAVHDEPAIRLPAFRDVFTSVGGLIFNTPAERRFVHGLFPVGAVPQATIGLGVSPPPGPSTESLEPVATTPVRDRPYLLCLGRVDNGKGTDAIARAFAEYKRRRPGPLQLVFAGPVVHAPTAGPDVVVLGAVDEPRKWALLRDAVALVSPSPNESLALVLLESWQAGTPVIVNAECAPTREQVERSGGGLLFGSYAEFEVCVDELVDRPRLRVRLGQQGRAYTQRRYDWESVIARYAAFLELVVQRAAR